MSPGFDATAPSLHDEQQQLVRSVYASHPSRQETHWLEWKQTLDLTIKPGQAKIAKAILGFANRSPETVRRAAGGHGDLLVGVRPGLLAGVTRIDAAALEDGVARYVGRRVQWRPDYVHIDGKDVLVIRVEAPRWGDPIHALHKGLEGKCSMSRGAIYIRRQAATAVADESEIEMLSQRNASRPRRRSPLPLVTPQARRDQFRIQVVSSPRVLLLDRIDLSERARDEYLQAVQGGPPKPRRAAVRSNRAEIARLLSAGGPGQRTTQQPDRAIEVSADSAELRRRLLPATVAGAMVRDIGGLSLTLQNKTDLTVVGVELELKAPVGCGLFDQRDVLGVLPQSPTRDQQMQRFEARQQGQPEVSENPQPLRAHMPLGQAGRRRQDPADPRRFVFDNVTVRAGRSARLPKIYVVAGRSMSPGMYSLGWSATATNAPRRVEGAVQMAVADAVWTPCQLLAA